MRVADRVTLYLLRFNLLIIVCVLGLILYHIIAPGISHIDFVFLLESPRNSMTEGGIFPCIAGSFLLVTLSMLFTLPLGVITAIYLAEYSRKKIYTTIINQAISNLTGIPSVVFGLFGLAFFVKFLGLRTSIISGSLTLALMVLPVIIKTSEEALKSVPDGIREASLALGATKFETIIRVVLPSALPGILTGSILSLGRVAGETAPIIETEPTLSSDPNVITLPALS